MKIIYTLIALCSSCLLNAQKAGAPDSSFGINGKVITGFSTDNLQSLASAKKQANDKIIVVVVFWVYNPEQILWEAFWQCATPKMALLTTVQFTGNDGITIVNVGVNYLAVDGAGGSNTE